MGITYNGVSLDFCETESVEQMPEYDDSGCDMLWTVVRIHVAGVLNPLTQPASVLGPTGGAVTAGQAAAAIRHALLIPRRSLTYTAGSGTPASASKSVGFQFVDAQTGPTPLYANLAVVTPTTITFKFGIEVRVLECDFPNVFNPVPRYLSHRWEDSRSTNASGFDTLRRTGILITAATNLVKAGQATTPNPDAPHPDDYNTLAMVDGLKPCPPGFRRERSFTLDPSGLRLRYELVDHQLARTPPAGGLPGGAVRMTGRQIESVDRMSQLRTGEIQLRVEGANKNSLPDGVLALAPQNDQFVIQSLLKLAVRVCLQRVESTNAWRFGKLNNSILLGGTFAEDLSDDRYAVEVVMTWAIRPEATRIGSLAVDGSWVGAPLANGYDPVTGLPWAVNPPVRQGYQIIDEDVARLFAAQLVDMCGPAGTDTRPHAYSTAVTTLQLLQTQVTGTPVVMTLPDNSTMTVVIQLVSPDDSNARYADPDKGIYALYECVIHYQHDDGVIVLPVTDPNKSRVKVRVCSPEASARVEWKAAKWGEPPEIPLRASADPNAVFTRGTVMPMNVDVAADGATPLYSVAGVYEYEYLDASAVAMAAPRPPYLDLTLERNSLLAFKNARNTNPIDIPITPVGSGNAPGDVNDSIFNTTRRPADDPRPGANLGGTSGPSG